MLCNKQQTLILLREKGYKYTVVNQADYTNIFPLQLAPMLLVHLAGSFVIALCPNSFDDHFLKYMGNCNYFKNNDNVLRQVLQIFFFSVDTHGAHLYSHADFVSLYTSHLMA